MLTITSLTIARTYELFEYKEIGFKLDSFPGYTDDQWGIKAHNRPWIESFANFHVGQRIIELGGAYSLFPKYLNDKYGVEAWIGDDFGHSGGEAIWSRWGNFKELPEKYPSVKYVFQPFGIFSEEYPNNYFDVLFSISTLEHIPMNKRLDVFKDANRVTKEGGKQLHTIDISIPSLKQCLLYGLGDKLSFLDNLSARFCSEIKGWVNLMCLSGINLATEIPNSIELLSREILVESPDVVYRFYPPNNKPKAYHPTASLLVVIEDL
ncbi:class I SAM-dependent methyltransferase [Synechocystis sp. PCC 7338]|uniref:class I SAM-dependent methyltransferase n=1 Tax=Synechocystis sp. PCC 7338 TaxID=2732530 RepID=UPI001BB070E6|nr:class I SAM-dependent methyltransferase [Synechocystis sp. PCC 7338]QUS59967.1 methyltransferase domain-containing protein [Synechocystis sp. PCC 7338]